MCVNIKILVTWMMDVGIISLDYYDLGKHDVFLGGLHGSCTMGDTTHDMCTGFV
jgi:hypothetical protein